MKLETFWNQLPEEDFGEIPQRFVLDPSLDRFTIYAQIKEKGKHPKTDNFGIRKYIGCLPIFWSKVAGVTMEGRNNKIRKLDSMHVKTNSVLKAYFEYDNQNKYHRNAIKVIAFVEFADKKVSRPEHIGYVPAKLANFIKFANKANANYVPIKPKIKTSKEWVSVSFDVVPNFNEKKKVRENIEDEPKRIPMVKKTITGNSIDDFRKALLKTSKKKKEK